MNRLTPIQNQFNTHLQLAHAEQKLALLFKQEKQLKEQIAESQTRVEALRKNLQNSTVSL